MRQVATAFVAMTCLFIAAADSVQAQQPGGVAIGFFNTSQSSVIVKGFTIVNGTPRPGLLLPIGKGGKAYEDGVPPGIRFYTVFDANNPTRVLLRDFPVPVQNRPMVLRIITAPNDPTRILIVP